MDNLISLNIALQLPDEQVKQIKESVTEIVRGTTVAFSVSQSEYIPHITVYQNEFYVKNKKRIEDDLAQISEDFSRFTLEFIRMSLFKVADSGSIWVHVSYPQMLRDIHYRLLSLSEDWLDGHVREKFKPGVTFTIHCTITKKKCCINMATI